MSYFQDADVMQFENEIEEDDEARANINIYRDPRATMDSDAEEDFPKISLTEMLEAVDLNREQPEE